MRKENYTYYCDRCGNEIATYPESYMAPNNSYKIEKDNYIYIHLNYKTDDERYLDLCDECKEALERWWNEPNA